MRLKLITTIIILGISLLTSNEVSASRKKLTNTIFRCNQDTMLPLLLTLDLNYYKGKPVDSILSVLPMTYTNRIIHGIDNLKYASVLSIRYPDSIRVLIFVNEFTHMDPRSETLQWDLNLFKQENVECIEIWQGGVFLKSLRCRER